jgi:DNA-binding transcriptional ArsR family regulator
MKQAWIMLNAPTPPRPGDFTRAPQPASTQPAGPQLAGTEPTQLQLRSAAATFALLGSAPRLHLAWLMAHETSDVGTLARRVGLSIPTTSQHLAKLRLAGIVSARREGRHTYYTIEDPHVLTMLDQIFGHIAPDGTLAPDPQ